MVGFSRLWTHRPSKPNIDFPEMLTSMGDSLCPLVRQLVNGKAAFGAAFLGGRASGRASDAVKIFNIPSLQFFFQFVLTFRNVKDNSQQIQFFKSSIFEIVKSVCIDIQFPIKSFLYKKKKSFTVRSTYRVSRFSYKKSFFPVHYVK